MLAGTRRDGLVLTFETLRAEPIGAFCDGHEACAIDGLYLIASCARLGMNVRLEHADNLALTISLASLADVHEAIRHSRILAPEFRGERPAILAPSAVTLLLHQRCRNTQ